MIIKEISAKKILNSRNEETIEVIVDSDIGKGMGRAPSGKSTSSKEVKAFPQGVSEAVNFVNNTLSKELINFNLEKFDDFKKLENLLKKINNPEKKLKVIHVAGTNGKGSVCAMLSSIIESASLLGIVFELMYKS